MNGKRNPLFWTRAVYDFKIKEARVQILFMGQVIAQLQPQDAADFAEALVQASSNAIADGFWMTFLLEREGISEEIVRQKISDLVEWRRTKEPFTGADRKAAARK